MSMNTSNSSSLILPQKGAKTKLPAPDNSGSSPMTSVEVVALPLRSAEVVVAKD